MDRIILNERNYKIWSNLVLDELEDANLEHTITPHVNSSESTTEGDTEGTTGSITGKIVNINTIPAKDDSKARRII